MVTLRGHADSVNAVRFLPYSNTLSTCSSDKTISIWDARIVSYHGNYRCTVSLTPRSLFRGCVYRHTTAISTRVMTSHLLYWLVLYTHTDRHTVHTLLSVVQGHDLFSCDCFGCVFHWDVRANTSQANWDFGPHAVSALTLDPAGNIQVALFCCVAMHYAL